MATKIIFGNVDASGTRISGEGFSCKPVATGLYEIEFDENFGRAPAIVGSQINYGKLDQDTRDGVVFPQLNKKIAIAKTGDSFGKGTNRDFSFIAIGIT